ncbi:GNAT family N-acetyltransferase [Emticicia sp. CRIBPO]|uniref:GNAT family N-acetyltransferase n=1 Tax=Emticicia sp. CRIBPO TaxID=2683258 RepID=UPI0014126EC4|nr:GNAT family N-acetyltransferase [Emticicia sp. CRIBPO]NBA85654.1 GNAT family N-acetyltransferase [Emticicia sp. CRIBPO]
MKNILIRTASETDLEILLAFERGIIAAERPFDSTLKEGEIHYYDLVQLIARPDAELVVAEIDQEVLGSGYALIRKAQDYLQHSHYAYLGFMYVKPEHRGKGINRLILESLKQWALSQGIKEIRLEVYEDNVMARKAYEKAGFKGNLLEMRLGLNDH